MRKTIFGISTAFILAVSSSLPAAATTPMVNQASTQNNFSVSINESRATVKDNETVAKNSLVSDEQSQTYSDRDIVAFLLFAQGEVAENNPEAVAKAKSNKHIASISKEEAYKVVDDYLRYNSSFDSTISPKLRSSSPAVVQEGITEFSQNFLEFVANIAPRQAQFSKNASAQGCSWSGCVKSNAYALTNAAVVWQAAAVTTVGAVTIATAVAVILYLPGSSDMNELQAQNETKRIMGALN